MVVLAALAGKQCRRTVRGNYGHLPPHQVGHQVWKPIISAIRPAIFNHNIAALDITRFFQPLAKPSRQWRISFKGFSLFKNPITGIAGCCARAASGHAPPRRRAA